MLPEPSLFLKHLKETQGHLALSAKHLEVRGHGGEWATLGKGIKDKRHIGRKWEERREGGEVFKQP